MIGNDCVQIILLMLFAYYFGIFDDFDRRRIEH